MTMKEDPIEWLRFADKDSRLEWCKNNGHSCRLCNRIDCEHNDNYILQIQMEKGVD